MLSKYLSPGLKAEVQVQWSSADEKYASQDIDYQSKTYISKLQAVISEDELLITVPMEGTRVYAIPVGYEINIVFYAKQGLFQCLCVVKSIVKENNVHLLVVSVISNLRKIQRREYYRFSCALELSSRELSEEERKVLEQKKRYSLSTEMPLRRSVIVDLSGGGMRFMSSQSYSVGSYIYCSYQLNVKGDMKKYELVGQVLDVRKKEGTPVIFEHRVQFVNMPERTRDEIIKIIFELERQNRTGKGK
jgi:c-di-GMP-binding flagellar brake protein YcgR